MKENKKGFTLIELLAVIVILGVLLGIAIPVVSKYITNSRKESFVSTGKIFIDSVRNDATTEEYPLPVNPNDLTIVTLDKAAVQKAKEKSAFGGKYLFNKSYVVIVNVGSGTYPEYLYYFAAQDSKDYAIPLTLESELDSDKVIANAKNKMEVTIQAICGSDDGKLSDYATVSGLDSIQPVDGDGNKINWNARIFSTSACGLSDE